ncbi:kinesin-related protein 4-like [Populus alba x Populus x berolinensis]|nr:kinesin-related protein 4-like [Populus alba x Populus x berolinensis]
MNYESPWQHLLEASLPPPAHEFEAYNEFETDQKARGIQQAFNYFLAAGPDSPHQSSNITDTDKKGQDLEATKDQIAKKRKIDRAYRERCKRNKIETERNLEQLRKENDRLKGENASFKMEAVRTRQTLQSQEQEMKRLRKTIVLLKEKHDKQNTVVEVLSKRLAGANDTDLQRENTLLKSKILLLRSQVNDQNNVDKLQLQEKNAQLEHEKSSLEVIVQALCEKINNEKGHEGDHAS